MALRQLAPGTILSGRYQLGDLIGESDLSAVYAASDTRGGAQIALKTFDSSVMGRPAALSEYQTQARMASGLGVEGIARAYDFGIDANSGVAFSTAERISWASLDRRVAAQGPLGATELSRGLAVLARALDAAHAGKVVHRDLKPQNIFISPENPEWVRITDFGVSAVRRGAPEALGWGGPPGYTPPDAVDAAAVPTPGVDLFALGVVAFFALTRGTPFRSLRHPTFDPNAHWSELNQPLGPLSERAKEIGVALDAAFDAWFARALALAPQARFRSAGEMARELAFVAEQMSARGGGGRRSMPGIAAAIAQPLVFQPEPSPASLGLSGTVPLHAVSPFASAAASKPQAASVAAAAAPSSARASTLVSSDEIIVVPERGSAKLPLLIGAGVLLLGGLAFGAYAAFRKGSETPAPEAAATAPASALASSAPPAAASAAPSGPASVRFSCRPEACEWIVCDGKNVTGFEQEVPLAPGSHECSASKLGFASTAVTFTSSPGQVSEVVFELSPLPAAAAKAATPATPAVAAPAKAAALAPKTPATAKSAAPASTKPAASATPAKSAPAAKSATAAPAAKAATTAKSATPTKTAAPAAPVAKETTTKKKKCSTFLGCK